MKMTKRDVADITLVWMAVAFVMAFVQALITIGSIIGMTDDAMQFTDRGTAITFQAIALLVLGFVNYMLIFKRGILLSIVFPRAEDKELSVPEGLTVLTSYGFWIRLLGIFTLLQSGTKFLGRLSMDIAANKQFVSKTFWMHSSGALFISTMLAGLVIWKADWIASKVGATKPSIGIGTPLARRPSHITDHTDHVISDSAVRQGSSEENQSE